MRIDLNCDLGQSYGIYRLGQDEDVMRGDHVGERGVWVPRRRPDGDLKAPACASWRSGTD